MSCPSRIGRGAAGAVRLVKATASGVGRARPPPRWVVGRLPAHQPEGHPRLRAGHDDLLPGVLPSLLVRPMTDRDGARRLDGETPRQRDDPGQERTTRGGPVS